MSHALLSWSAGHVSCLALLVGGSCPIWSAGHGDSYYSALLVGGSPPVPCSPGRPVSHIACDPGRPVTYFSLCS
ncbi:hypothetical protein OH76DRAFT_1407917 [Lentinus brumalis]|uniref:Secreted protein n=1 Tax=Lentinus brumalis TaxID=2498619 RepID=A0A371CZ26_9APHY|nr:hypothetical protein OH76DRAFT_1407917 [Polyporus brumalis]